MNLALKPQKICQLHHHRGKYLVNIELKIVKMGEDVLHRYLNNVVTVFRIISVEPAYLGFALSWGLYCIVSNELYISKVRI